MTSVLALLAQADTPDQIDVPHIEWAALLPFMVLVVGAIVLLSVASLMRNRLPEGFFATFTVVTALGGIVAAVPLWDRVQDAGRGPFSAVDQAIGVDGF